MQSPILWQFRSELVMGNEHGLHGIVEHRQQKDNKKIRRPKTERGKSQRVKLDNQIFQFSWQPAGTTQSNSSQVKGQRSKVTYHIKFTLSMLCYSPRPVKPPLMREAHGITFSRGTTTTWNLSKVRGHTPVQVLALPSTTPLVCF